MKTEGFVKLLRKIIREEVSKTIKTELKPLLKEIIGNKDNINLQEIKDIVEPTKPLTKKQYTKNAVLNDLLNETSGHKSDNPWPTVDFRSEMATSFGGRQQNVPLATHDVNGAPVNMSNENVAKTVDLMTKDYSALMKAIDKKKGKR